MLVAGLNDAADVAVGDTNTCVRTRDGHVLCWGENGYGQLGDGTTESRLQPTETKFCSRAPQPIFPESPPGQPLVAALQRSQCLGACPVYSVRVYADGSVIYRGDTFVRVRGGRKARLTGAEMQALHAAFRDARFLEIPYRCGQVATDAPTARLYYTDGRKARLISNYHGCKGAPVRVAELENEVDRIVGTDRWVGNTGREKSAPDVEAFEPPLSVPGVKTEDQRGPRRNVMKWMVAFVLACSGCQDCSPRGQVAGPVIRRVLLSRRLTRISCGGFGRLPFSRRLTRISCGFGRLPSALVLGALASDV